MNFKRANSTLKNLEYKNEISLAEVLGFFQDICEDLEEEQDQTLDELSIGDESKLVGRLLWIGQEINGVLKSKKSKLTDPGRAAKLNKQSDRLSSELEALEMVKDDVKILQEKERALLKVQKEKEEQNRQKQKLLTECSRIEEENRQLETGSILQLEKKKNVLVQEKQLLLDKCEKLQEKEKTLRKDSTYLQEQIREKAQKVGELENTNSKAMSKITQLKSDIECLTADLEVMNSRIGNLDSKKKELVESIKTLDDNMKTMNIEVLRKRYEEKASEYAQLEKEGNAIIGEERTVSANLTALENLLTEYKKAIEENTEKIEKLEEEKILLEKSVKDTGDRKIELETWFQGLEYQAYEEDLKYLKRRVEILETSKQALFREMDHGFLMTVEGSKAQMRAFREELEVSLRNIQDEIDNLQRKYLIVSKAIYDEGENLL